LLRLDGSRTGSVDMLLRAVLERIQHSQDPRATKRDPIPAGGASARPELARC
jgi:hypothetical protein